MYFKKKGKYVFFKVCLYKMDKNFIQQNWLNKVFSFMVRNIGNGDDWLLRFVFFFE